jgi:hypothetical protein
MDWRRWLQSLRLTAKRTAKKDQKGNNGSPGGLNVPAATAGVRSAGRDTVTDGRDKQRASAPSSESSDLFACFNCNQLIVVTQATDDGDTIRVRPNNTGCSTGHDQWAATCWGELKKATQAINRIHVPEKLIGAAYDAVTDGPVSALVSAGVEPLNDGLWNRLDEARPASECESLNKTADAIEHSLDFVSNGVTWLAETLGAPSWFADLAGQVVDHVALELTRR